MSSSNLINQSANKYCKYDVKCEKVATNQCQGCEQKHCIDHCLEHQWKLQEDFKHIIHTQRLLCKKLKSLISQLPADDVLDLIKQIYEFKMKSNGTEKTVNITQQQLQVLINEDKQDLKKKLIIMTNGLESDQNDYIENYIKRLRKDIKELQIKFDEINYYSQKRASHIIDTNVLLDNQSETMKLLTSIPISSKKKYPFQSVVGTLKNGISQKSDDIPLLSHLLSKQMSPAILNLNENESALTKVENKTNPETEEEEDKNEEAIVVLDSTATPKTTQKIRLSNNIIRFIRGPLKTLLDHTMNAIDVCTQEISTSDIVIQAVKRGLVKQKQIMMEEQITKNSLKPAFAEITSDWKLESANDNQGFSSRSVWMHNPHGQRILVKTHDHQLSAANEWLLYILGRKLGLPVNEAQIAIYKNELVTLHTDVADRNEKTITFMNLPKKKRKLLLTQPIMECMDLFDRIIQNVDRNQQNILITMANTTDINDDSAKLKIHLVDHGACFGMAKLNGISVIASKFHYNDLSVIEFNPINQARKFEQYLSKLPIADRPLISKTLNRFAAITDDQFDSWLTEVQDLLSSGQYNRINGVLRRQRDIAKRYIKQWGISTRSSSVKSNQTMTRF